MDITLILTLTVCGCAFIGFVCGIIKGYTKVSAWGGAVVITMLTARLLISKIAAGSYYGCIILGVTFGVLIVLLLLFALVRRYINDAMERARKYSYYKTYDEREEKTERILTSIDDGDKKSYRKYTKREVRISSGPWGVVNRVFGAVTVALNASVIAGMVISMALVVSDLTGIVGLKNLFAPVYRQAAWINVGSQWAFDLVLVTVACACLRTGFRSGILSLASTLVVLALLCGGAFVSYLLAFGSDPFISMAQSLNDGVLADLTEQLNGLGVEGLTVCKAIVAAGIFIVFLIPIILTGIFLPRWIDRIKGDGAVAVVDGAIGAVLLSAVVFAALVFAFAVLYTLNDLAFLAKFNTYMNTNDVMNVILYGYNPLNGLAFFRDLPLHDWLA